MSAEVSERTDAAYWQDRAEYWEAECDIIQADAAKIEESLRLHIAELEEERDRLQAELDDAHDRLEAADDEAETIEQEHEQLVTLLSDYRVFGWIDRLDEALKLAENAA